MIIVFETYKMVKKIEYFQCDCEEGKLEEIARTRASGYYREHGVMEGENMLPIYQTTFFSCDTCDLVYRKDNKLPATPDPLMPDTNGTIEEMLDPYGMRIKPYLGELTKQEIEKYSPSIKGKLNQNEENKIILKRN